MIQYLGQSPPMRVLELPWGLFHPGREGHFPCLYPVVQDDVGNAVLLDHRFELRHPELGLQAVWLFALPDNDVLYCGPREIPAADLPRIAEALRRASQESP